MPLKTLRKFSNLQAYTNGFTAEVVITRLLKVPDPMNKHTMTICAEADDVNKNT